MIGNWLMSAKPKPQKGSGLANNLVAKTMMQAYNANATPTGIQQISDLKVKRFTQFPIATKKQVIESKRIADSYCGAVDNGIKVLNNMGRVEQASAKGVKAMGQYVQQQMSAELQKQQANSQLGQAAAKQIPIYQESASQLNVALNESRAERVAIAQKYAQVSGY